MNIIEKKLIQKNLTENFIKLMPTFYEMESSFLSGVYKRYGDLEGGNIVIFFARDCHLEILRKREKDLNFNLSLDNFWNMFFLLSLSSIFQPNRCKHPYAKT